VAAAAAACGGSTCKSILSLSLFHPIVSLLQYSSHPCERALDGSRIDVDYLKECLNDRERKRR